MDEFNTVPTKAVCIGGPCDGAVIDVPRDPSQEGWEIQNIADPDGWSYVYHVPYHSDVTPRPEKPSFYVRYRYEFRGDWRDMKTMQLQLVEARKVLPDEVRNA